MIGVLLNCEILNKHDVRSGCEIDFRIRFNIVLGNCGKFKNYEFFMINDCPCRLERWSGYNKVMFNM